MRGGRGFGMAIALGSAMALGAGACALDWSVPNVAPKDATAPIVPIEAAAPTVTTDAHAPPDAQDAHPPVPDARIDAPVKCNITADCIKVGGYCPGSGCDGTTNPSGSECVQPFQTKPCMGGRVCTCSGKDYDNMCQALAAGDTPAGASNICSGTFGLKACGDVYCTDTDYCAHWPALEPQCVFVDPNQCQVGDCMCIAQWIAQKLGHPCQQTGPSCLDRDVYCGGAK